LQAEGISGTEQELEEFSNRYSNPWILKRIAKDIRTVFEGQVSEFVENMSIFIDDEMTIFLDNQFQQLSQLQKKIIYWIAIRRNTASWNQLLQDSSPFINKCLELGFYSSLSKFG
jgi:hypothetical protein